MPANKKALYARCGGANDHDDDADDDYDNDVAAAQVFSQRVALQFI